VCLCFQVSAKCSHQKESKVSDDEEEDDVLREDSLASSVVTSRRTSAESPTSTRRLSADSMPSTPGDVRTEVVPSHAKKVKRGAPGTDVAKVLSDFLTSSRSEEQEVTKVVSAYNLHLIY